MTVPSFTKLPPEIIYLVFEYLSQEDVARGFIELNSYFSCLVKYFLGHHLNLTTVTDALSFDFCMLRVLPIVGTNLRSLKLTSSFPLLPYLQCIKLACPYLNHLEIFCSRGGEDIRHYAKTCLHQGVRHLNLKINGESVDRSLAQRLLDRCNDETFENIEISSEVTFHLSSVNDLVLLKRFCQSEQIPNGIYMIECLVTGGFLTETDEDLCVLPTKCDENNLFMIQQIDPYQCSLEYELFHLLTGRSLSVLIQEPYAEHILPTSILSAHRKASSLVCSTFTFERTHDNDDHLYIRPCYSNAKRLETRGKRIIVSLDIHQNTLHHCFKLHRVS